MVGKYIIYHWPLRLGGWLLGQVTAINTDSTVKVGESICNFSVYYEADKDTAHHFLSLKSYAKSAKSKTDSWVLVQEL